MDSDPLASFDTSKPNIARAYDYILGGKDNFAADRELSAKILEIYPLAGTLARENRLFLASAVDRVARQHVTQFIDVGAGLPTRPNTHETATNVDPAARVVYVDNDPVVISHTTALLTDSGRVAAIPGDVRRPDEILANAALGKLIDLDQPACVIMAMILHFIEPAEAARAVAAFVAALAPGSFLILSVGVNNEANLAERVTSAYTAGSLHVHDRAQIAGYLTGLELQPPGLVPVRNWLSMNPGEKSRPADLLVAVARKAPS